MTQTLFRCALSLSAALLLACGDAPRRDLPAYASVTPLPLQDGLFYVADSSDASALTVDFSVSNEVPDYWARPDPVVREHVLPAPSVAHRPMASGRDALVLTSGREAVREGGRLRPAEPSQLIHFSILGMSPGRVLNGRYAQLALSEDDRYAIAFGARGSLTLQNAIEVISLEQPGVTTGGVVMDLTFDGRAPTRFVFAPPGFFYPLALAPMPNALQVIDLEHPEHGEIAVTLGEARALDPQQIVFGGRGFFVRSSGSERILMFDIVPTPGGAHRFQLAPSVLTASGPVQDLALTYVPAVQAHRVLALGSRLDVLDPLTGESTGVERTSGFTRLHTFDGTSPVDDQVAPRALLYAPGRAQVAFVEIGAGAGWAGRSAELIELGEPIRELFLLAAHKLAVATHGSARVSVIDLQARTVGPISLDAPLVASLVDELVAPRLWVETTAGTLGMLELRAPFTATQLPITVSAPLLSPSSPTNLVRVPRQNGRRLAVLQAAEGGRVTLLNADQPSAESAVELVGFLLAGLFD